MINKVILIGRLGADPEIRQAGNTQVANLRLATSESWKDKNTGDRIEKTEWHTVVAFGDGLAGVLQQYANKGSMLYVEGKLQTRKWQDNAGADRYSTEVIVQASGTIKILGASQQQPESKSNDLDDEIPF